MARARPAILAIDQGTTSSRAIAFSPEGEVLALAQQELPPIYPRPGWVEHDPELIWASTLSTARKAFAEAEDKGWSPAAIGIANQRETTIVWERKGGRAIHNAVVWQDRRTADRCQALAASGAGPMVAAKTGLVLDPYFSATKLAWILDHAPGARERAGRGELAFGTVESFLLWRLTGGARHASDATNASRTSLYDIERGAWDEELLGLFNAPAGVLPEVVDCIGPLGETPRDLFGRALPILGLAGDQQAAAIGQACFAPGDMKSTYGTGAFMLLNTGTRSLRSASRLLTTIAYRVKGATAYALEGSVLSAGSAVQWLRDGLGLIARAGEIEALASAASPQSEVYLVPAFTGLGAPYWAAEARAALVGLTRDAGRAEIAQAALDASAYQTWELLDCMAKDGAPARRLKVDGGMTANDHFLQRLADICDVEVVRPAFTETTAWGAACLAGVGAGLIESLEAAGRLWRADKSFTPKLDPSRREQLRAGWRRAVGQVLGRTPG